MVVKIKKVVFLFFHVKKEKTEASSSILQTQPNEPIASSSSSLTSSDMDSLSQLHKQAISWTRKITSNTQAIK
ncbi:hypothetical protein [Legionella rowbothamii]|uniref:hypothetical protein n=1 Tax=Legionella rowbothamii TaxID=96229 RepID=UPI0013EF7555|nr:hypothetical protein [Legionella rowbothamii]